MISDGVTRIASVTSNTGDGQVDWVFTPNTRYMNKDDLLVFETTAIALIAIDATGAGVDLDNPITTTDLGNFWAGMWSDWTSSPTRNCSNWTDEGDEYGTVGITNSILHTAMPSHAVSQGQWPRRIICVEQ